MGIPCCNDYSSPRKKKIISIQKPENEIDINSQFEIDDNIKYSQIELDLIMKKFINQTIKTDVFHDYNDGNEILNSQKQYEKKELNKFFEINNNKIKEQISIALDITKASSENSDMYINKLISDIINLENGKKIYEEKIEKIIKSYEQDDKVRNNKINNRINILVIGKQGTGKKTLVNKIFKLKNININIESNFGQEIQEYESEELPFFKFVLIKFDINFQFSFNDYKNRIINYINEQYQTNNKNNYINCIWYCFTNGFLNNEEMELIKSLNDSFNKMIPVILVHTMSANIQQILNSLSNLNINQEDFVILLAEDFVSQFNGIFLESYGVDFLIVKTLEKYKNTFSLYDDEIKNDILNSIKTKNEDICIFVNEQIIKNFVNEYKYPKVKDAFVEYLTDIFGMNIKFFLAKKIDMQSINKINSEYILIQPMMQFIQFYEENSSILVETEINSFITNFDEYQKNLESKGKNSFNKNNIRNSDDIKKKIKKYLTDNYNYIFQKHYVYEILYKKYEFFCQNFKKEFDNISEQIIFNTNINNIKFLQFEKQVKEFFGINNNINNNFVNNNDNNIKGQSISIINDGTFINNNEMNNAMNVLNENNYFMNNNNINNPNNMNFLNNANIINSINNNNVNDQTALNLPSRTEVEMNYNAKNMGVSNIYPNI